MLISIGIVFRFNKTPLFRDFEYNYARIYPLFVTHKLLTRYVSLLLTNYSQMLLTRYSNFRLLVLTINLNFGNNFGGGGGQKRINIKFFQDRIKVHLVELGKLTFFFMRPSFIQG